MTTSLDLGCGSRPRNPFGADVVLGLDVDPLYADVLADLVVDPIPLDDCSVDYVTAFDFVEHVPRLLYANGRRRNPFVELLNEVHRVLVPGGTFLAHTPAWPHPEAHVDPTHVNVITEGTAEYWTNPYYEPLARSYGIRGRFAAQPQRWSAEVPYHLVWQWVKV